VGVSISVDDFGTGYSSLSHLKRLPIDEIKVDRSFVTNMKNDSNDAMIVRATVDLGRNLGLRVVAEGVEDPQTWSQLVEIGCDLAQGYYLGRPMPEPAVTRWLAEGRAEIGIAAADREPAPIRGLGSSPRRDGLYRPVPPVPLHPETRSR
jgi:EAL domain-containing protein (putative c-di-GMP-specific phosphodiesterase class I)